MDNLYSEKVYFKLIYGNTELITKEPLDWDKMLLKFPRDKEFYGFTSEYFDGNIRLTWPLSDGGQFIKDIIDNDGSEAILNFQFGFLEGYEEIPDYTGQLNLAEYGRNDNGVTCDIEKVAFECTLRNRYDVNIKIDADKDLDDLAITPPTPIVLNLHSKAIYKVTSNNIEDVEMSPVESEIENTGTFIDLWMQPDTNSFSQTELEKTFNYPMGLSYTAPDQQERYQYLVYERGVLTVDVIFSFDIAFTPTMPGAPMGNFFFWVYRGGVKVYSNDISLNFGAPIPVIGYRVVNGASPYSNTYDVQVGDKVYFGFYFEQQAAALGAKSINFVNFISLGQTTYEDISDSDAYRIFDVLNQAVYIMTGKPNRLISSFFDTGGEAEKYALLNGYSLRNYNVTDHPMQLSFKKAVQAIKAIFNIGVGYRSILGEDYIMVEKMMHYFNDAIIIMIDAVFDYEETYLKDYIYNEFESGYEKYENDSYKTIDEFNTEQTLLLPLKQTKNKLPEKCPFIASGFAIETQRREQFKEQIAESVNNDDEIFIIAYRTVSGDHYAEKDEPFDTLTNVFSPETIYNGRITPKHMEYNWAPLLNIGTNFQHDSFLIKTTLAKNDNTFTVRFDPSEPNKMYAGVETLVQNGEIFLEDFGDRVRPFLPNGANFKARVPFSDINKLKQALKGDWPTGDGMEDINHGCIVAPDDFGVKWLFHVLGVDYEPSKEIATFQCAKIRQY